jgi:hypothetical protein
LLRVPNSERGQLTVKCLQKREQALIRVGDGKDEEERERSVLEMGGGERSEKNVRLRAATSYNPISRRKKNTMPTACQ